MEIAEESKDWIKKIPGVKNITKFFSYMNKSLENMDELEVKNNVQSTKRRSFMVMHDSDFGKALLYNVIKSKKGTIKKKTTKVEMNSPMENIIGGVNKNEYIGLDNLLNVKVNTPDISCTSPSKKITAFNADLRSNYSQSPEPTRFLRQRQQLTVSNNVNV